MTRVSILTSSHSTFDTRIFHKEARSLADAGYDVTLVTPHDSDVERDGVTIRAVGEADVGSADLGHVREMYAEAKSLPTDVYHLHDPGLLPVGLVLVHGTEAKVIYDCHEDYDRAFRYYRSVPLRPLVSRLYPAVQSAVAKRFDAVVAATDWIAEDFRERGHREVQLVQNFPRCSMVKEGVADVERTADHAMVYVGGMSPERGFTDMLELTARLDERGVDAELWLLGTQTDETTATLERVTAANGIEDRVRCFGYVEPDEIFHYLRAADLGLCLLSGGRAEYIIPTKMFEYMLSGIPVVATETAATRKYLPPECGRLVSEAMDDRVDVVAELLSSPGRRARMGRAGRRKVEEEYSWEVESERLLSLYERLTAQR
jgi:glycosyltransferase involved in cell wall biosynthesis